MDLWPRLLPQLRNFPSLVYLDQNGIKYLSDDYLLELEKTQKTDFLYFVSSSYSWRFGKTQEFRKHLKIDFDELKKNPYRFIHNSLIAQLKNRLPTSTRLKLYPFSIKKGANIYGIVFGAKHPRAVDKFLNIAWKRNGINGEANFDIHDDERKRQGRLFDRENSKIEAFEAQVRRKILNREIDNNFQLFNFALDRGHIGSHAAKVLKNLKKGGTVMFDGVSPLVTYENVYSRKRKIIYTVMNI